ncbi:MAG: 50S ribosomal protein L29 [Dehalococcoidia bacterium]|nr:MAG: 50S ribosomal protein L29 [Dehalococcoidia bacterium]
MKSEEVRMLSDGEIRKKLDESDRELVNLSVRVASRQLVNHRELVKTKRDVARLKTILKERELGIR